ncbi:MAG: hypothetical protein K2J83_01395, partial [Clostridia bacterium]|nr:hypothetical protein [Clostridia bacterium]
MFEGVNDEYGVVTFDEETKTATLNKLSISYHQLLNYIAFKSEITVPAMTEYSIDYSFTATYKRTANSISETMVGMCVFYFGNTYEDPNAQDQSSKVEFKCSTSGTNSPAEYVVGDYSSTTNTAKTSTGEISTITYTNDTNEAATYTAYFGVSSYGSAGSTYANTNTTSLVMSDKLTVTAIDVPTVDKKSADFNPEGNTFNFTYDHDRVVLSSVTHKGFSGAAQDVSGEVFIDENGECLLTDAGVYTFNFDIADYCGAVWDSSSNDQTTKKVEITINTPTVDIPYIDKNSQEYTSEELTFTLMDFDGDLIKVDKVTASNSANSATFDVGTQNFKATNADTYTVTLKLADEDNYVWSDDVGGNGTRTLKFVVTQKELSLKYESSHTNSLGNAEWKADDNDVTITVTDDSFDGDDLSLIFYYDAKGNSLGTSNGKSTELDMTGIVSGEHTLYVDFAVKTGVNANYTISNGSYSFNVKAASAQTDFKWVYYEGDTKKEYIEDGGKITYKKDTTYKVELVIPDDAKIEVLGYQAQSGSAVKSYKTTVSIKSTDPENLFYDEDGNSSETTTLTLNWSIEQAEVDVENVKFEYNGGEGAKTYDASNPPEYTELNFTITVPEANYPEGVTNINVIYDGDRKGPGTIYFHLEFTLDSNYKSSTDETLVKYSMEISGKKVSVGWILTDLKDENGNEVKDENGVTYQVYVLDLDQSDPLYKYINYEYYEKSGSTYGEIISEGIMHVVTPTAQGGLGAGYNGHTETVYVRAYIGTDSLGNSAPSLNGVPYYVLDFGVQSEYKIMTVGENKDPVDLSAGEVTFITYGEKVENVGDLYSLIKRLDKEELSPSFYTVALYKGTTLVNKDINAVDFTKLDAGTDYKLSFALTEAAAESYALTSSSLKFTVKPVELTAPTLKDGATFTFNGDKQGITSSLDNWDEEYMEFAANSIHEARNAGSYSVIINIKEELAGNYIFVLPESTAEPVKALVRFALVEEELPEISNNSSTASFKWTIEKYVIDTTASTAWNFAASGASLNLPNWVKALTAGAEPTLNIQVVYYDTDGNPLTEYELKGGNSFLVAVYVDPACADFGNIEFKNQSVDPMTSLTTSPQTAYTVPMSGAAAFIGNVRDFVTKTWLGLPIWAWLAIGLVVLILLIIIIAVACKRRKSKEERAEAKARKEEERQMQREKLEAERELAKAKQEAALEKIRAQAQIAAGAGMASTAMQQPAQQQAPVQAPPVQQQMPVQQQQAQPQFMPAPQPQYAPQPLPSAFNMSDVNAIAEAKAAQAIAEAKAAQAQARAAEAIAEAKAAQAVAGIAPWQGGMNYGYANQQPQAQNQQPIVIVVDSDGQIKSVQQLNQPQQSMIQPILIATSSDIAKSAQKTAELPQITEESKNSASATYPPDAVITTTTTVDTTKKGLSAREESVNDGRMFDIDG